MNPVAGHEKSSLGFSAAQLPFKSKSGVEGD
jgi:hypothetical protein